MKHASRISRSATPLARHQMLRSLALHPKGAKMRTPNPFLWVQPQQKVRVRKLSIPLPLPRFHCPNRFQQVPRIHPHIHRDRDQGHLGRPDHCLLWERCLDQHCIRQCIIHHHRHRGLHGMDLMAIHPILRPQIRRWHKAFIGGFCATEWNLFSSQSHIKDTTCCKRGWYEKLVDLKFGPKLR